MSKPGSTIDPTIYRDFVEETDSIVIRFDPGGRITFANHAVEGVFGLPPEACLGRKIIDFVHPDDHEENLALIRSLQQDSIQQITFECRHKGKEGHIPTILWALKAYHDTDGSLLYNNAIGLDITVLKNSERKLRAVNRFTELARSHQEVTAFLGACVTEIKSMTGCEAVGIRLLDRQGNVPYQAYEGFSCEFYEQESPLSIHRHECMCLDVIKGETDPSLPFYTAVGSFFMNGTTRFLATVSEEKKGETRNACNAFGYESVALIPLRFGERIIGLIHLADRRDDMVPHDLVEIMENVAGYIGSDVARFRAEDALVRMASFAELNPAPVMRFDEDGAIIQANEAALDLIGKEPFKHLSLPAILPELTVEKLKTVIQEGAIETYDNSIGNKDFQFVIKGVSELGVGHIYGSEITRRKKAEESLEHKTIALREIIREVEHEKDCIKDDVAANVNEILIPIIRKLEEEATAGGVTDDSRESAYIRILRHGLDELLSSFGRVVSKQTIDLTPRELEICSMVKSGLSSKEISKVLNVSCQTVCKHRLHIRRKLGLTTTGQNLSMYLRQL